MNQSVNPYEPAEPIDDRTRLTFDSVIELRDYEALLPNRDFEKTQKWILFGVFVFVSVGLPAAIIPELMKGGLRVGMTRIAITSLAMMAVALFVARYILTGQRARRKLRHNPDLLGIARGELNESGVVFDDGTRQRWFGPQLLYNTEVTNDGIRVYLGEDQAKQLEFLPDFAPDRYLALTARMFDGYNADVAQRFKQRWREMAATSASSDAHVGWEAWTELNPAPADAIKFVGTVTLTQTMQTPEAFKLAIHQSLIIVGAIMLVVFPSRFGMWWLSFLLAFAIVPFLLYDNVKRWWQFFRASNSVNKWNQRGWISPHELAILKDSRGQRFSLEEVDNCVDHDGYLEMKTLAGSTYFIARDHVVSDADWIQIVAVFQRMLTKPPCQDDGTRSVRFSNGTGE